MPTARWFRATAGTDPVRALASVAWGVGVGLALTACDTTNKGMAAASGCDGAACPVGTSLEEARSVSSTERDVSDGAGPSGGESGGKGFSLMSEGSCSYACVADSPCPTGTWPVITEDCFTCALLDSDGQVIESECEFEGATGTPDSGDPDDSGDPLDPPTSPTWEQLALGEVHSCARFTDGTLDCWGDSDPPAIGAADQLVAGDAGTCALDGPSVSCWTRSAGAPELLDPMPSAAQSVAIGSDTACAVDTAGALSCWGAVELSLPGPVSGVVAGAGYACAVGTSGALTCLGDDALTVVRDAPSTTFAQVSAGPTHACGRTSSGRVSCWGEDFDGATAVPDGTTYQAVAVGDAFTCAIDAEHEAVCWGRSGDGQTAPPDDLGPVVAIGAGRAHACATTWDARRVCWGRDDAGQSSP